MKYEKGKGGIVEGRAETKIPAGLQSGAMVLKGALDISIQRNEASTLEEVLKTCGIVIEGTVEYTADIIVE